MEENLDKSLIEGLRNTILQQMQVVKDRFIDDQMRKMNDFTQDWNQLVNKRVELDKKLADSDKLNPPA